MSGKGKGKDGSRGKPNSASRRPAPSPPIAAAAGGPSSTTTAYAAQASNSARAGWRLAFKLVILAMVVGPIVLALLMLCRSPTQIVADLVVRRLVFATSHDMPPVAITDQAISFEALTLEKFSKVSFRPTRLEALHGKPGARSAERLSVEPGADVAIHGDGHPGASVSMAAPDGGRIRVGRLESFSARTPAVISIGTTQGTPPTFTISVTGQMQAPSILPSGPFDLTTQHTTLTGTLPQQRQDKVQMRPALSEASPYLEIQAGADGLTLTITPVGPEPVHFLAKGGTAIEKVELISQNSRGDLETSLAGNGTISFPQFPDKKSLALTENDALSLDELAGMSITALAFRPQQGLLHVKLEGTAGKIRSKSGTTSTDHRSTWLDEVLNSVFLKVLYALFATLISVLVIFGVHVEELWHRFRHAPRSSE